MLEQKKTQQPQQPPELDADLINIFKRLVNGESELAQDDYDKLNEFSDALPQSIKDSAFDNAKARLQKLLLSSHADNELDSYEVFRRIIMEGSQQTARFEKRLNNHHGLSSKLACRPVMLPVLHGNQDRRFVDFLKRTNYLSKQDIQNLGKKFAKNFKCSTKPAHYGAIVEVSIGNPDLIKMESGQAKFISHPTYKVLNKALEHLDLPSLHTLEGRRHYHNEENSKLLLSDLSKFQGTNGRTFDRPDTAELSLVLHMLPTIVRHRIVTEGGSDDELNHITTAIFCICAIMGVVLLPTILVGLHSLSLARHILPMSIDSQVQPDSLFQILDDSGQISALLDLQISCVNPLVLRDVPRVQVGLELVENYLLDFITRYPELCKTISERFCGNNGALIEIRNQNFIESLGKFLVRMFDDRLSFLLSTDFAKGYIEANPKLVELFQATLKQAKEHIDLGMLSVQVDNSDGIHDNVIECISRNLLIGDKLDTEYNAFEAKKKSLDSAIKTGDYQLVSQIGGKLANSDHATTLGDCLELNTNALSSIIKRLVKAPSASPHTYVWINPKIEETSLQPEPATEGNDSTRHQISKLTRELDATRIENANLRQQSTKMSTTINELKQSEQEELEALNIVKQFMFGEKVSLGEVVKLVAASFPHVKFGDEMPEHIERCAYQNPHKLNKFLHLLCDEYFEAISTGTADSEARQILGKAYRANESSSVLNNSKFRKQREHIVDGEKHLFTRHLTISQSRDPKSSCQVYFDVIDGQLVIGYIGSHLDNTLT